MGFLSLVGVETATKFDPQARLVTSPFFSATVLAALRLFLGVYMLAALLSSLIFRGVERHDAGRWFSYFTNMTGVGVCAYMLHAGWLTAAYAIRSRSASGGASYPLQRWPRWLQVLHMLLLASIRTLPVVVTAVYWGLLSDDSKSSPWDRYNNISVHALNTLFALFEIICTHTPPSTWFSLVFMTLILAGYVGVAYITHADQGFYTYDFLDTEHGAKVAIYIVAIPVANALVFAAVNGLIWVRMRFAPKPLLAAPVATKKDIETGTEASVSPTRGDDEALEKRTAL